MRFQRVVGAEGVVIVVVLGTFSVVCVCGVVARPGVYSQTRMLVQVFQPRRNRHEGAALRFAQHRLRQAVRPGFEGDGSGQAVPRGKVFWLLAQQVLQHLGLVEAKALVEDHGHHLGAQVDHLHQKTDFCALLLQALAQHIVAFGVLCQVIELGQIGRAQVVKVRG